MSGSSALGRVFSLRRILPLLMLALLFLPALLVGGCAGNKNKEPGYTADFDREILIEFKPEVTEPERTALYEKYELRYLGPFGDRPNSYLLLLRDDMEPLEVEAQIEKEPGVVSVIRTPQGPF